MNHTSLKNAFCSHGIVVENAKTKEKSWITQSADRNNVMKRYQTFIESLGEFNINQEFDEISILPLWHGTTLNSTNLIKKEGFYPLQKTDEGYFGKGIYLSNSAQYSGRNYGKSLILCWTIVSNPYPVIFSDFVRIIIKSLFHFIIKF